MNHILDNSRTINEKRKFFTDESSINPHYLKEWRNIRTLLNDNYFKEMLKVEGMSENEFTFALQPMEELSRIKEDCWFDEFLDIFNMFSYDTINYSFGINVVFLPFLTVIQKYLEDLTVQLKKITVEKQVLESFMEVVQIEMFNILGKLVAVELEIYKQCHEFISENKEERFQEFLKGNFYSKESFLNFYKKYPVAARVAMVRMNYLKTNFGKLLLRLDNDYVELCNFLDLRELHLTSIELSTGDSHEQGNAVAILCFGGSKVVYKPRNLEISEAFQTFIDWYVSHSDLIDLKIPRGIYHENYSYNEFIEKIHCKGNGEIEKFYIRYGYLTAICYLLGINDLHMENIVAMGEYPVIVDIETMFQVAPTMENENLYMKILKLLEVNSVSNSCLLPKQLNVGLEGQVEFSALNGKGTKIKSKMLVPINLNRDDFHFEKQNGYFKGGNNIPTVNKSEEVDFNKYRFKIIEGFNDFMLFVMTHKKEFVKELSTFKGKKIRMLMKGTERYASMLRYANHPNYNSNMKYRERLMMNIWAYPYFDKRIVSSEVRDMLFNDIPIFYSFSDSIDIIDSQGKVYKNYFEKSGFATSIERIYQLDEEELNRQNTIMISTLGLADETLNEQKKLIKIKAISYKFSYVKEAENIAERLIKDAIETEAEASFINLDSDKEQHWKMIACDESFYGGLSGVACLFLILYYQTKKEKYWIFYQKLIYTAINQARLLPFQGAFNGWLSPIYPILIEYELLGSITDKSFLELTIENLNMLSEKDLENISETDYISGIAGVLRLINKMKLFPNIGGISDDIVINITKILKTRIIEGSESSLQVGIAHGLSGLALSLLSESERNYSLIKSLLTKEMFLNIKESDIYKWCWGISGMIQARIEILKVIPDLEIQEQLQKLINNYESIVHEIPQDDTLCHGTGGMLITLKSILDYSGDKKWREKIDILLSNIKSNSILKEYAIQKLYDIETKGLFDGISGVALSYLSMENNIPNLLLLSLK